jgi:hypothetical protein
MLEVMTAPILSTGLVTMFILFGVNLLLWIFCKYLSLTQSSDESNKESNKEQVIQTKSKTNIVEPFTGTLKDFANITRDLGITGAIMLITYLCENFPLFPHGSKQYSRDLFFFVCMTLLAVSIYSQKPTKDLTLLSRAQTEEWKGWMQIIFLLYHYFHAKEVYNSVRVMITCYVWMTGFGNFSFFFFKRDFGWLRVVQMLWRLNFCVILLMLWHGNTYILYYICPLHTFYFVCTYAVMFVAHSTCNHSRWRVRIKIFAFAVLIYLIWDINGGVFKFLWGWLGTEKIIGAGSGTVWEWYFRTSLDKYSAVMGMIFACNYPLTEQWFKKAANSKFYIALWVPGCLMFIACIWWMIEIYPKSKLEYNLVHNYFAFIPLLSYIFFRNITPKVRSRISMFLHAIGKTTLETYLLQHHVWLTSNAKTTLVLVPGYPWVNFALTSLLFVVLAKILYRMTMNLRGMLLPDDKDITLRNIIIICIAALYLAFVGNMITLFQLGMGGVMIGIGLTLMLLLVFIRWRCPDVSQHARFFSGLCCSMIVTVVLCVIGITMITSTNIIDATSVRYEGEAPVLSENPEVGQDQISQCLICSDTSSFCEGRWNSMPCEDPSVEMPQLTFCEQNIWESSISDDDDVTCQSCVPTALKQSKMQDLYADHRVIFIGDSNLRKVYHAFNSQIDESYSFDIQFSLKAHSDLSFQSNSGTDVEFIWAPFLNNISTKLKSLSGPSQEINSVIFMSGGLWDLLHNVKSKSIEDSSLLVEMDELQNIISAFNPIKLRSDDAISTSVSQIIGWIQPLPVVTKNLQTEEKLKYIPEVKVKLYRESLISSGFADNVSVLIDPSHVCDFNHQTLSSDGVHYGRDIYFVLAQMVANSCRCIFSQISNSNPSKIASNADTEYVPKEPNGMGFPWLGLGVVSMALILLLSMDNFMGLGWIGLTAFSCGHVTLSWESAYQPLLEQLGLLNPIKNNVVNDELHCAEQNEEAEHLLQISSSNQA